MVYKTVRQNLNPCSLYWYGLLTPHGDLDLGQHRLGSWHAASLHQAITLLQRCSLCVTGKWVVEFYEKRTWKMRNAYGCELFDNIQQLTRFVTSADRNVSVLHDDVIKWNISALLTLCAGNSPVTGEFPTQRPVMRSFGFFFLSAPESKLDKAVDLKRYRAHYNVTVMRFAIAWTHGRIFNWWFIHVYWEKTLQTWNNKGTSSDNTRQINSVDCMWVKKLPCVYDISPISRIL